MPEPRKLTHSGVFIDDADHEATNEEVMTEGDSLSYLNGSLLSAVLIGLGIVLVVAMLALAALFHITAGLALWDSFSQWHDALGKATAPELLLLCGSTAVALLPVALAISNHFRNRPKGNT